MILSQFVALVRLTILNVSLLQDFYYPQARQLNQHNTYFLMSGATPGAGGDGFERAGTVGFRCVRDIEGEPSVGQSVATSAHVDK